MSPPSDAERLDALEMRVAHQDAVIEELNGVVTAQGARIEALVRRLGALAEQIADAEAQAGQGAPQQPPPHY